MIVCKFGGSSVADATQIRKVKSIVDADPERQVVVVSAPGRRSKDDEKVTDMLYACNALVQQGLSCRSLFKKVASRYTDILADLGMDEKPFLPVLEEVRQMIDAGHGAEYSASRGEYLSARLVATFFGWNFLDTDPAIVINHDGTVHESTWKNLDLAIKKGQHYIVPGFYGADTEGNVKTFSRGGSDITGAILSRAVNASIYENWTDVSGVFSVDPRLVEDAKVVATMSYREVRELAGVGAGVFHEEAIAPVVSCGIPINVKNTNFPLDRGTVIVPSREIGENPLVGISAKNGFSRVRLRKLMLFKKSGIRHALLTMLHIFGIRPSFSLFGVDSIVWFFETSQASDSVVNAMCTRLKSEFALDSIEVDKGHAIVGVVGNGVMEDSNLIANCATALAESNIKLNFLNYGSSDTSLLIGVDSEKAQDAVKSLYKALF
ncbi:aspartate kinase [Sphaerochaeta pleomorpha str. Grapes]|uniref:Aspartokinase n=1 Tax=Sphaerochaeta pleomorpha (strain ATCC BAA-1885 / DSM 22778 / Grapes) TaxID=158190 RepID=G8QSM5_SPHPG|nr:aspartate kinase [Sphaerochaeta pleomorpha]AEV28986.1 aspartate kinase [Sphaerochaeta pleomorpha str. Grapes]